MTTRPSREQIIAVLDREGACCGSCGREPGSPLSECQGCEHCLGDYADAVLRLLDTLPDAADCWEAGHHAGEYDAATAVARGGMRRTPNPYRKEALR